MAAEHPVYKGFYIIPFANRSLVNKAGDFISLDTGAKIKTWISKNRGSKQVSIKNNDKYLICDVAAVIGRVFLNIPKELEDKETFIFFKDRDRTNIDLNNLYWDTRVNYLRDKWQETYAKRKLDFPLPNYDSGKGLFPNPIECKYKAGYFHIPIPEVYVVVNRQGEFFNLLTDETQYSHVDRKGYVNISLGRRDRFSCYPVHRIMAMLFVDKPERHQNISVYDLFVNHLDGVKENNNPPNLEWCTNEENLKHAWATGLSNSNKVVLSRNIETNEITPIFSIAEMARRFFIAPMSIRAHLNSLVVGRVVHEGLVFKWDDGSDWPEDIFPEVEHLRIGTSCDIVVESEDGSTKHIFNSIHEACSILGYDARRVSDHKRKYGLDKPFNGWYFKTFANYALGPRS
jgi:hypothetical protein